MVRVVVTPNTKISLKPKILRKKVIKRYKEENLQKGEPAIITAFKDYQLQKAQPALS